jgi:hypothetical protein
MTSLSRTHRCYLGCEPGNRSSVSFGFAHGDGWFDILWRLCEDLEPLVAAFEQESGLQFEVLQVKEKFGGLRIHVNHANDAIRQRLEAAQGIASYLRGLRTAGKTAQWRLE